MTVVSETEHLMKDVYGLDHAVSSFDRLVGTWDVIGDATGKIEFRRLVGGHVLQQNGYLDHNGRRTTFTEIIGRVHPADGRPDHEITSRVYTSDGHTLDYTHEIIGDELTIWTGARGSDNVFRGRFENDDRVLYGSWTWPGGGYSVYATRVD